MAAALLVLGLLGSCSVLASEIPGQAAWLLAGIAPLYGVALAVWYLRRGWHTVSWDGSSGVVRVDDVAVEQTCLYWRGPLASLHYRDSTGRRFSLLWWPDTLPGPARRELRLVARSGTSGPDLASMAP